MEERALADDLQVVVGKVILRGLRIDGASRDSNESDSQPVARRLTRQTASPS